MKKSEITMGMIDDFMDHAANGNLHGMHGILASGLPIHQEDIHGASALHHAAQQNQVRVLDFLLQQGLEIDAVDRNGNTPLHRAAINESSLACQFLLDRGASIGIRNKRQETPLFLCAQYNVKGVTKSLEILLRAGAHVNEEAGHGLKVLHVTTETDRMELLIKAGADVNAKNALGCNPIHDLHMSSDALDMFHLLLRHGADIHAEDDMGDTPLHTSAKFCRDDICFMLVQAGADVNARNQAGQTPMMCALSSKQSDRQLNTLRLLIVHGADQEGCILPAQVRNLSQLQLAAQLGMTDLIISLMKEPPFDTMHTPEELFQLAMDKGKKETAAAIQSIAASREIDRILSTVPPRFGPSFP